jgi:outer membrane protein assembly factor BamB
VVFDLFAVVPILTNAGVALLPAVLAGVGSVMALLLKPREAIALCRRKPHVPALALVILAAIAGGVWWLMLPAPKADPPAQAAATKTDWTAVALQILRDEKLAGSGATATATATNTQASAPQQVEPFNRRGNFLRTGHVGGPPLRRLQPLWEYNSNQGYFYFSDAAVYGDRVYAAGCLQDLTGIFGTLTCVDARGGKLWEVDKTEREPLKGFFSSPVLTGDGKFLVIGQGLHTDKGCDLMCFETASGRLKWKHKTPLNHIEGSPAIRGDLAVVGAGAIENEQGVATEGPGVVLAVRISTGEKLWEYMVIDPESSPAIGEDGTVYLGSGCNGKAVVALRSETDAELKRLDKPRLIWSHPVEYPALGTVTLAGDKLLIGIGEGDFVKAAPVPAGQVLCLEQKTGKEVWKRSVGDAVLGAVAVANDTAFASVRNGEIVAMQLADGKIRWRQAVSGKTPLLASPAVAGRCVYAVANNGTLAILDQNDGKVLEKHQVNAANAPGVEGYSYSSPIIVDGRLYVGSETGGMRCFIGGKENP